MYAQSKMMFSDSYVEPGRVKMFDPTCGSLSVFVDLLPPQTLDIISARVTKLRPGATIKSVWRRSL